MCLADKCCTQSKACVHASTAVMSYHCKARHSNKKVENIPALIWQGFWEDCRRGLDIMSLKVEHGKLVSSESTQSPLGLPSSWL